MNHSTWAVLGAILAGVTPAIAADTSNPIIIPDDTATQWAPAPASLPQGIMISLIAGDPSRPGPFVLRLTVPAHTVIKPHTHATAETVTVLTGDIYHDLGPTIEKETAKELHTGGFVYLPKDHPHSLWTTSVPSKIEVTGTGPFGLHYVNPADDPSKKS